MVFEVIILAITILLTFYIVFSAAKCRMSLIKNQYVEHEELYKNVTSCLSKITIILAVAWWVSIILNSFAVTEVSFLDPNSFIDGTLFLVVGIICILALLVFRNTTYKKYLDDNITRVLYIEYSLSFISGLLYAFMFTYAIQTALNLF
ncbi:MAG: hypothetical protein K8Q99_00635 [Acholeplasmataceae bacterium]|nr:hypothetical protein [Acholeplasmataceae bacterium]